MVLLPPPRWHEVNTAFAQTELVGLPTHMRDGDKIEVEEVSIRSPGLPIASVRAEW